MEIRAEKLSAPNWLFVLPLAGAVLTILISTSMPYQQQDIRPWLEHVPFEWLQPYVSVPSFTYGGDPVSVAASGVEGYVEFFIRKASHVFMFTVIFMAALFAVYPYSFSFWGKLAGAYSFVFLFALVDEFRQHFSPDRHGMWQDVVLDMTGVTAAAVIVVLGWLWRYGSKYM
ncbi:VanZ family protein [Marinococcus halophilus]|uniref:VanZ family protein n=1 Tax=Marinococcus halophilus TaxID=1371 RepID=A0A510Y6X6_MARHA|nr:VanZ family protein [Marinococcus halophilus]GEK59120.1 VanZ family protein [Marinococcus halophilus]